MPPGTVAGFVFLIAALSPGFVYHRMLARFLPRDSRSTVVELAEMATVGALTTAFAVTVVLGIGELTPALLSPSDLAGDPNALRAQPWGVLGSAVLTLLLSLGFAATSGWLWVRKFGNAQRRMREGSVWIGVLAAKRAGKPAFLAVELDDGRLIEGVFRSVSGAEDPARDALVLRRPILVSGPGDTPRTPVDEDFVLLPRTTVRAIHGTYALQQKKVETDGILLQTQGRATGTGDQRSGA
jgi:hypothetical protein